MRYGIPYKGSKSRLCELIIKLLPKGKPIRDVFGGGGAVTLCALDSNYYNTIHYNELDHDIFNVFQYLVQGKLYINDIKQKFITREEFIEIKNKEHKTPIDTILLLCYSFGNSMYTYMYGKDIEEWKRLLHILHFKQGIDNQEKLDDLLHKLTEARIYKLIDGTQYRVYAKWNYEDYRLCKYTRTQYRYKIMERLKLDGSNLDYGNEDINHGKNFQLQRLESLESLESLQSLQSLERLQRLQSLELHNKDYRDLNIPEGDVIYCDPPYEGSDGYKIGDFDSVAFRERAEEKSKTNPVYISSYKGREGRKKYETNKGNIVGKKDGKHTDHKEFIFYK